MSWYKDDKDTWKELIETVAAETARSNNMVEKDTIQSMFLNNLVESGLPFVLRAVHLCRKFTVLSIDSLKILICL